MLKLIKKFIIYSILLLTVSGCFTPETLVNFKHKILGTEVDTTSEPTESVTALTLTSLYDGFCALTSDDKEYCWGKKNIDAIGIPYAQDFSNRLAVESVLRGKTIIDFKIFGFNNCALTDEKRLYCWGYNGSGILGIGRDTEQSVPVAVDTLGVMNGKDIIDFQIGEKNACAIDSNNILYCWGDNNLGQLGSGSIATHSNSPVVVQLSGKTVQSVSISAGHICTLATDSSIYCWGENVRGQLGNGTIVNSSVPVQVDVTGLPFGVTPVSLSIVNEKSCLIGSDNKLYCWGLGYFIGLANNLINYLVPTAIPIAGVADVTIKSFKHNREIGCVITVNDEGYCWGNNTSGQSGAGVVSNISETPVPIVPTGSLSSGLKSISISTFKVCALSLTNEAFCWGSGGIGDGAVRNGSGNYDAVLSPVNISTPSLLNGKNLTEIITSEYNICAKDINNEVYCWSGEYNAGDGQAAGINSPVAISKTGGLIGKTFLKIDNNNSSNVCGITSANEIYCWGLGGFAQGNGTYYAQLAPGPIYYHAISNVGLTNVVFSHHDNLGISCLQKDNGDFYCKNNEEKYVYNFNFTHNIKKMFFTEDLYANCVLTTNNKVFCWGYGEGFFVNTALDSASTPIEIDHSSLLAGKTIKELGVGSAHACIVASDDKVYCWGKSTAGELGDGLNTSSRTPVALDPASALGTQTVKKLFVKNNLSCVIATDDLVYCWGAMLNGVLGNGAIADALSPVAVSLPVGVKAKDILMTKYNVCMISLADELYCWGEGSSGVLGNGGSAVIGTPVAVVMPGSLGVKKISMSDEFACAIASDDNAYCWGTGVSGEMGNALYTALSPPVAVSKLPGVLDGKTVTSISTTAHSACVVASDNKIYCWGGGVDGQLANNISANSNVPVEVLYTP